jgi:hypothetical protein
VSREEHFIKLSEFRKAKKAQKCIIEGRPWSLFRAGGMVARKGKSFFYFSYVYWPYKNQLTITAN